MAKVATLHTERLELIPGTIDLANAAIEDPRTLGEMLNAIVPPSWPPIYLDAKALQFFIDRLSNAPEQENWWLYFIVLENGPTGRTLIGSAGYFGPASEDGTVEIGYGIVDDQRRMGYASEAVRGLLARAFNFPEVRRVIAHTYPALIPSIGVLKKCGFKLVGDGAEEGTIRFELLKDEAMRELNRSSSDAGA